MEFVSKLVTLSFVQILLKITAGSSLICTKTGHSDLLGSLHRIPRRGLPQRTADGRTGQDHAKGPAGALRAAGREGRQEKVSEILSLRKKFISKMKLRKKINLKNEILKIKKFPFFAETKTTTRTWSNNSKKRTETTFSS